MAEKQTLIDSIKDSFPIFYEKILKTDIKKNHYWLSENAIDSLNKVSSFLESKVAITPILLDFDRIVSFSFGLCYSNNPKVRINMRMISNSKVEILPVLKNFTYIKERILQNC